MPDFNWDESLIVTALNELEDQVESACAEAEEVARDIEERAGEYADSISEALAQLKEQIRNLRDIARERPS